MLNSLHIENIAVIKSVDIDFSSGFTALTGETGAGKSIIIDSINLLLGKKLERELIRTGENEAMVSGFFSSLSDSTLAALAGFGISCDEDGGILIQRTVTKDGKSTVKINGRTVGLTVLKSISANLVNIHGQSDTFALLSADNHLKILDMFSENNSLLEEYSALFNEYDSICREITAIKEKETERERMIEILEYQVADIDSMGLVPDEEDQLIDKKIKIKNSERIIKQAGFVFKALKGSEKGSVSYLLERSSQALESLSDVIPNFLEYSEKIRDFLYQIDDIAEEVYASFEDFDDDPTEKLNDIESRLDKISKIKRKYGLTVEAVLQFREKAYAELELLKNSEDILQQLTEKERVAYNKAKELASLLHERRAEYAARLENEVMKILEFLDMPKVRFVISVKENFDKGEYKLSDSGFDCVEFQISANKGLDIKSISKIASGGELARIMLALKSVIADKDGVMTLIFDEIDAGVSGKTARKIGIKMLELSRTTQLLTVTHSAQIASLCDSHLLIKKDTVGGSTETDITELSDEGRISELSRILGGINVTEAQKEAAMDMLREREIYNKKIGV